MNRLLLVIILCLTSISYAQNHKIIYQHILHPNIINNEGTLKLAASIIEEEAKLNPEMIYFRVHFLNEIYGNKNISNETNGKKELDIARRKYIAERNIWLDKQIDNINKNYNDKYGAGKVLSFFQNLKMKPLGKSNDYSIPIDTNKLDFFAAFYLSRGTVNKYDEHIKYKNFREEHERKVVLRITNLSEANNKESDIMPEDIYDEIENNLHILLKRNDFDFGALLLEKELDDYSIKKVSTIGIGVNYSSDIIRTQNNVNILNERIKSPYKIGDVTALRNLSFELSYKIFLKDVISYFSYIDASLFYSNYKSTSSINTKEHYSIFSLTGRPIGSIEEYNTIRYKNIEFSDGGHFDIGIKVLTPIWVVTPNIIFELGGMFYSQSDSYEVKYTYDYRNYTAHYNRFGYYMYSEEIESISDVDEVENTTETKIKVFPLVSIKYINIFNHLDIVLTTDLHYYSTGIRLTY